MTFAQLIKMLDLLDHDKEIIIKKELPNSDPDDDLNDEYVFVDKFSKYDEIQEYVKYFKYPGCHFFICEDDDFTGDEIKGY